MKTYIFIMRNRFIGDLYEGDSACDIHIELPDRQTAVKVAQELTRAQLYTAITTCGRSYLECDKYTGPDTIGETRWYCDWIVEENEAGETTGSIPCEEFEKANWDDE